MPLSQRPLPRGTVHRARVGVTKTGPQSQNPSCGKLSSPPCTMKEKVGLAYRCVVSPTNPIRLLLLYAEGVCHGQPVAGIMSVPAHEAKSQQPTSRQPRLRFPHPGTRPAAPNLPPTTPPLESLASSSNPIYLTVLVSMPSPRAYENARQDNGPPVVELGVSEVTCTPNVA
jgi:hypothetical protein